MTSASMNVTTTNNNSKSINYLQSPSMDSSYLNESEVSEIKSDEKYWSDDSDCDQESIVVKHFDSREKVPISMDKNEHILRNIGKVYSKYTFPEYYYSKTAHGTATVFHVYVTHDSKTAYALTAAHNIRHTVMHCVKCKKYMEKQSNLNYCPICGYKLQNIIIHPKTIQFSRNEIKPQTWSKDEDGDNVIYSYGDCKKIYICTVEYIPDVEYEKYPKAKSGNDYAIISFKITDNYDYEKYSKCISIKNETEKLKNKQIYGYRIFGYPQYSNNEIVGMRGMRSTTKNYDIKICFKTQNGYLKQKDVDASSGQSGAVLWYKPNDNSQNVIIFAIHTGGSEKKKYNVATIIDDKILSEIDKIRYRKGYDKKYCQHKNTINRHTGSIIHYHSGDIQQYHPGQLYHPGSTQYSHSGQPCHKKVAEYRKSHTGNLERKHPGIVFEKNRCFYYACCHQKSAEKPMGCQFVRWTCCNQDEYGSGCKSTEIMNTLWFYDCCDKLLGDTGCIAKKSCCQKGIDSIGCKWSCCDYNENIQGCQQRYSCCNGTMSCSTKYSCCNLLLSSKPCITVCKDCGMH